MKCYSLFALKDFKQNWTFRKNMSAKSPDLDPTLSEFESSKVEIKVQIAVRTLELFNVRSFRRK